MRITTWDRLISRPRGESQFRPLAPNQVEIHMAALEFEFSWTRPSSNRERSATPKASQKKTTSQSKKIKDWKSWSNWPRLETKSSLSQRKNRAGSPSHHRELRGNGNTTPREWYSGNWGGNSQQRANSQWLHLSVRQSVRPMPNLQHPHQVGIQQHQPWAPQTQVWQR